MTINFRYKKSTINPMEKRFFENDIKKRLKTLQRNFSQIINDNSNFMITVTNQSPAEVELHGNYGNPEKCVQVISLTITERTLMIASKKWFLKFTKLLQKK